MIGLVKIEKLNKYSELSHCYTTKHGGVSNGVFSSLNMGFNRGDNHENVMQNYNIVAKELGLDTHDLVLSHQVHGDNIRIITNEDKGKGIHRKSDIIGVDGLITNQPGIGLVTFYADCVPLFFYDRVHHVIGLSHAGWRGTVSKIGPKTIAKMHDEYGTNAKDVIVGIGPSIGGCCYEVSQDVKKEFDLSFNDDIIAKVAKPQSNKYYLDLWEANRLSLIDVGVLKSHIEVSGICTKCQNKRFFSHRVMGNERGSQVAIFALKPEVII